MYNFPYTIDIRLKIFYRLFIDFYHFKIREGAFHKEARQDTHPRSDFDNRVATIGFQCPDYCSSYVLILKKMLSKMLFLLLPYPFPQYQTLSPKPVMCTFSSRSMNFLSIL